MEPSAAPSVYTRLHVGTESDPIPSGVLTGLFKMDARARVNKAVVAGVAGTDDPAVKPLPIDPADPTKDIW